MSTNLDPRNVTVGEAAPAEPRTEAQITADLERQRAELAATIDQLYARVQPAALAQEAKEEASARFTSFKESASLTLQDAAGGNAEALKKVGGRRHRRDRSAGDPLVALFPSRGPPCRPRGRRAHA